MKQRNVNTIAGGGGPAEPVPYLVPSGWTTKNVTVDITFPCHREERANASAVAIHWRPWRFNGIATHPADARNDACGQAAFTMADRLSLPTESTVIHLNPCEWTTNKTKALAGCRTTKNVNQSSLRATNGSVAIQSTNATISNGLPRVLRTLAMTNNKRATARLNCHSGLDPESYPRYEREFNAGKILNQVQDDSKRNNPIKNLTSYRLNDLVTCAGQGASLIGLRACGHAAFTMAEILLSLTIIGVVAAITLPSLTGNINERTWNTQRKALYARFSQAIALMPALNGYGTLTESESHSITADTAAETFVTDGLSKVLKINNICDSEHLADCGMPDKVTDLAGQMLYSNGFPKTLADYNSMFNGSYEADPSGTGTIVVLSYSQINTKAVAFETQNGESILLYYNPNCIADRLETEGFFSVQPYMCANFIYDLNGSKGPNTVGKDIGFITSLYPADSVTVAPLPLTYKVADVMSQIDAGAYCRSREMESRLPTRAEAAAMSYNRYLLAINAGSAWTSEVYSAGPNGEGWLQYLGPIQQFKSRRDDPCGRVLCVRR